MLKETLAQFREIRKRGKKGRRKAIRFVFSKFLSLSEEKENGAIA
jgi:hypothetical protein